MDIVEQITAVDGHEREAMQGIDIVAHLMDSAIGARTTAQVEGAPAFLMERLGGDNR